MGSHGVQGTGVPPHVMWSNYFQQWPIHVLRRYRPVALFVLGIAAGLMFGYLTFADDQTLNTELCTNPSRIDNPPEGEIPADSFSQLDDRNRELDDTNDNAAAAVAALADGERGARGIPVSDGTGGGGDGGAGSPCIPTPSVNSEADELSDLYRSILPETVRPRHLVLIGVMTTAAFIDTRAVAGYNTWGKHFEHLIYFSSEGTKSKHGLPVVGLNGIDDDYPPQRKSFAMLRYFATHFADIYSFFVRLDDDVYVRTTRLQWVLSMLNENSMFYIGQPGEGNKREKTSLGVETWRYCMGGPGVVFSRMVVKKLRYHIDDCLRRLMLSTHEDVEVGRCIHQKLHMSCSWNSEMWKLFFHGFHPSMIYSDQVNNHMLRFAVTVHPLKEQEHMYKLHNFYLMFQNLRLEHRIDSNNETIGDLFQFFSKTATSPKDAALWHLYRQRRTETKALQQPFRKARASTTFNDSQPLLEFSPVLFHSDVKPSLPQYPFKAGVYRTSLKRTLGRLMALRNKEIKNGSHERYTRLNEGYVAFDPIQGYRLVADSQIRKPRPGHRRPMPADNNNEVLELQHHLGPVVASKQRVDSFRATKMVSVVVMVSVQRAKKINGFLDTFQRYILDIDGGVEVKRVRLFALVFKERVKRRGASLEVAREGVEHVRRRIELLQSKYAGLDVHMETFPGRPLAADALVFVTRTFEGGWKATEDKTLVLLVDESVRMRRGLLQRCRLNAVHRDVIYAPIIFGRYHLPNPDSSSPFDWNFHSDNGEWLEDYYGIMCLHSPDMKASEKVFKDTHLWDEEEMAMFAGQLAEDGLDVMRAPEADVYRDYVPIDACDHIRQKSLNQQCMFLAASRIGNNLQLLRASVGEAVINPLLTAAPSRPAILGARQRDHRDTDDDVGRAKAAAVPAEEDNLQQGEEDQQEDEDNG